jgi:hypothetical protein
MAKIKHAPDIVEITGNRGGLVERRKTFHDYDGNITKEGRLEAYTLSPRNYKANPINAGERANMNAFGNASRLAQEFISALKNQTPLPRSKQALLNTYKTRFYKQLKGKPDPIAPKDKDGNFIIYARIDNFIRAAIRKEKPVLDE